MESSEGLRVIESSGSGSREALRAEGCGLSCADLMATDLAVVAPDESVSSAAVKMREQNLGFLPVCTPDGRLVGVLTDRDLALRVLAAGRSLVTPVGEVMSDQPVTCLASAEVEVADGLMRAHRKLRIPCVDEAGRLAGVISLADVARYCDHERAGDLLSELVDREVTGGSGKGRGQPDGPRTRRRAA
jgi:CBS domain-containing protein